MKDQKLNHKDHDKKVKVFFSPSGKQGLVDKNKTVLEIARNYGVDIDSAVSYTHLTLPTMS